MTENQIADYFLKQATFHDDKRKHYVKLYELMMELQTLQAEAVDKGIDITAQEPVIISSETPVFTTQPVKRTPVTNWGKTSKLKTRQQKDVAREQAAEPVVPTPEPEQSQGFLQVQSKPDPDPEIIEGKPYGYVSPVEDAELNAIKQSDEQIRQKVEKMNHISEEMEVIRKSNDPFPARMPVIVKPVVKPGFDPSIISTEKAVVKSRTKIDRSVYDNLMANTPGNAAKKMLANKWKGRIID